MLARRRYKAMEALKQHTARRKERRANERFDRHFTLCQREDCKEAMDPPEDCPECQRIEAAKEDFLRALQPPELLCTMCGRMMWRSTGAHKTLYLTEESEWADEAIFQALRHLSDPADPDTCIHDNVYTKARFQNSHFHDDDPHMEKPYHNIVCNK